MDNTISVGKNRTGLATAPQRKDTLVQYAQQDTGRIPSDSDAWSELHMQQALEADRVGTVPNPAKGAGSPVLIDKLGERLAFERTGVRLYEALIVKAAAASSGPLVDVAELERIRSDELEHFRLVARCLADIGADPTAMTPCADVTGVAASGHLQVLTDPRTTLAQALNSILMIELGDNASWDLLVELARDGGHGDMAKAFEVALQTEQEHLQKVRGWLRQAVLAEAS